MEPHSLPRHYILYPRVVQESSEPLIVVDLLSNWISLRHETQLKLISDNHF